MALPVNIKNLPAEMHDVLRFLGARGSAAKVGEISGALQLNDRVVLRAIRRLVNFYLIQMGDDGRYGVTSDGKRAYAGLIEADSAPKTAQAAQAKITITRRLTAVIPQAITFGQPAALFIGIDPPSGGVALPDPIHIDLKISALGGTVQTVMVPLVAQPGQAAEPARIVVTGKVTDKPLRVKIDAYQAFQVAELKVAGRLYFDIPILIQGVALPAGRRAVAAWLQLTEE